MSGEGVMTEERRALVAKNSLAVQELLASRLERAQWWQESDTEALFRLSLEQALCEQFGMTVVISPHRIRRNDETFEFDMVAHAGDKSDKVYLVEIKSLLREDGIIQLLDQLRQFPRLFSEHRGKKLFGILAALDIPEEIRLRAQREGLYLATIKDDVFEIGPPGDGFEPRAFGLRGLG